MDLSSVLDLFGRLKALEDEDGDEGWNGGDTVDVVSAWFREFGIDVDAGVAEAAQAVRVPPWLAHCINSQMLDAETSFVIHLHTDNPGFADTCRAHLNALVRALGEGTNAVVYDQPGSQILCIDHSALAPVLF